MKKIFVIFTLFCAMFLMISCGGGSKTGDNTDTGTTEADEDSAEGIYLGIIGFNYKLNIRELSYLTNTNMTEFQDFIDDFEMDDGTALYFADYTALKMMRDYTPVPPKLQTVALVTFTDGEDTSSDGPINDPENYNDPDVYINAIHNKIVNGGIHGLSVEAYSIGLRSGDTGSDFKSRLEKLASSSNNAFEVSNMEEVQERFTKIAEDLYSVFKTINIDFKVLGNYSDRTRMRFSLDIYCDHDENECEKNGKNSNLYIDATYRRNGDKRSFEDFAYHGFSGNLTTVECGTRDTKGFYPCKFENLKYDNMDTEIKQIELWKNDNGEWKHENEALKQEDSVINESKSSALIMLVLDCTTSLGNTKFKKLQEAGKDFIETLVSGGSETQAPITDSGDSTDTGDSTTDTGDSTTDTGDSTTDTGDSTDSGEPTDTGEEPSAPIVVNGGFENVDDSGIPSNWHTANSTGEYPFSSILTANISSVTDAAYVKSGTKAVKLVSSKNGNERFVADAIALAAGNYKCSVFAKGDTNVKIGFCKGNALSCSFNATTHTTLSDEWLEIVHEFTLAADEPTINFVIAVNSKANSTTKEGYFDDFVCSPLENYDPIFSDNNPI